MKGIELSKKFFNEYCLGELNNKAPHLIDKINVGLVGEGSECFFLDDEISRDHDFDKGFSIFIEEKYYKKYKDLLENLYRGFFGDEFIHNPRKGVICTENFYQRYTNKRNIPISNVDFLNIRESYLSVATNGEIFFGRDNLFMEMRKYYKNFYPRDVLYKKLAAYLFQMAQSGQYNLFRSIKRKDKIAVFFAKNEFISGAFGALYLLSENYMPYYKLRKRYLESKNYYPPELFTDLEIIATEENEEKLYYLVEKISIYILNILKLREIVDTRDNFLVKAAEDVTKRIKDPRIATIPIMKGNFNV
ncbi:DUF4037 domain-containing protein [Peptoniphilus sp. AGMB00490]|uniref:DUF4037 domain-containing protein n=2 Tax=Peptoniphilus TaxID=162289 RepID=A0ACD6AZR8_9FIRM|nr:MULTISPECIES: DUF4037 domain-containing protein [Peptoniphilus]NMW85314.1 DUF4037 domain-containing protein [Peptoniphilus faecalis]OLR65267.1 hypothetical protein BIV18_06955 [Peptoniphilus porci]